MLTEQQKQALLQLSPPDSVEQPGLKFEEPLGYHTYFRIGGPADAFLIYRDGHYYQPLKYILWFCRQNGLPVTILGGGSNVLVSDAGLVGLVIKMQTKNIFLGPPLRHDYTRIFVSGGEQVRNLASFAQQHNLTGLEPFTGLPGTVGGAIYNNSHYQPEQLFGNLVREVWTIPLALTHPEETKFYLQKDLGFGYDDSVFQHLPPDQKELIIMAEIALPTGDKKEISALTRWYEEERKKSQPLEFPSSGCIFKNPKGASAGEIIESLGLKGMNCGGAEISTKHANFIINPSHTATAKDVLFLIQRVRKIVRDKHGLDLQPEIFFLKNGKGGENE